MASLQYYEGGEEDGSIQSELGTITVEGDIRIECILIYDTDGKEVFRKYDSIGQ